MSDEQQPFVLSPSQEEFDKQIAEGKLQFPSSQTSVAATEVATTVTASQGTNRDVALFYVLSLDGYMATRGGSQATHEPLIPRGKLEEYVLEELGLGSSILIQALDEEKSPLPNPARSSDDGEADADMKPEDSTTA